MSSFDLQGFFESTAGQITSAALILILFAAILFLGKDKKPDTRALVLSAVFVALAVALNQVKLFHMPQGGSVTAFSMLPIVLCGYFLGVRRGLMAGMCMGIIDLIFGPYIIHPLQLLLDYPLAFGALALGAVFREKKGGLYLSYIIGVFCRYVCCAMSGIIFFGEYAPEGFNAVTWSLWYNLTFMGAECIITLAILFVPVVHKNIYMLKSQLL
ncbi:MAG: energy-coupled thiamine transporter ThiT [Eubacteriales bacterium]|nr:energy-coupled thiamine transporter ThiT [Eubacteriales bacterium]